MQLPEISDLKAGGVYKITCIATGKIYVGSALSFQKRFNSHKRELINGVHKNKHLQAAWDTCVENQFVFEVLECCEDRKTSFEREQFWLDTLKPWDKSIGFNKSKQATGLDPETAKLIMNRPDRKVLSSVTARKINDKINKDPILTAERKERGRKLGRLGNRVPPTNGKDVLSNWITNHPKERSENARKAGPYGGAAHAKRIAEDPIYRERRREIARESTRKREENYRNNPELARARSERCSQFGKLSRGGRGKLEAV